MFVDICDSGENQITIHNKFMWKTKKGQYTYYFLPMYSLCLV